MVLKLSRSRNSTPRRKGRFAAGEGETCSAQLIHSVQLGRPVRSVVVGQVVDVEASAARLAVTSCGAHSRVPPAQDWGGLDGEMDGAALAVFGDRRTSRAGVGLAVGHQLMASRRGGAVGREHGVEQGAGGCRTRRGCRAPGRNRPTSGWRR